MKPSNNQPVDLYIEQAADFAKPVLLHLRKLIHKAIPDIRETIKWGMPTFEHHGIVCHIAAFKHHCSFGLNNHQLLDHRDVFSTGDDSGMGQLGKIQLISDLPADDVIISCVQQAAELNEQGVKPASSTKSKATLPMPEDFAKQLNSKPNAKKQFNGFAAGYQRDYIEWIIEAKTAKTRQKRLDTSLQWIAEGKHRNWKYES